MARTVHAHPSSNAPADVDAGAEGAAPLLVAAPTEAPRAALAPEGPFALVFAYGPCALLYRLDTVAGTFSRERDGNAAPVSRPLRLTPEELASVRGRTEQIDFFGYPPRFVEHPAAGFMMQPAPAYDLSARDGGRIWRVQWDDGIIRPVSAEAARLRALAALIEHMIDAHPEATQLPPVFMGCA